MKVLSLQPCSVLINPKDKVKNGYEGYLFNTPDFLKIQKPDEFLTFKFFDHDSKLCLATLVIGIDKEIARSPFLAPFGSVEFGDGVNELNLQFLLQEVKKTLKEKHISELFIKSFPSCYPSDTAMLHQLYISNGFEVAKTEINFHLPVTAIDFENNLHLSEKRRLKKSENMGFQFEIIEEPKLPAIFQFIKTCRIQRNYSLNVPYEAFEKMFQQLPDHYKVFAITHQNKIIALTIGVLVNKNIMYNYLPCNDSAYMSYSPMVMLLKGVYGYCQQNDFKIFDLGPALGEDGSAAEGLLRFKKNIGAVASEKISYRIRYS